MQRFKLSFLTVSSLVLLGVFAASAALSQSGRGRPKVPVREPAAAPPASVKVPEATAVIKQEQAGNTSRFVLRNGMTVIISEQHAAPIAATAACFKASGLDESLASSPAAQLIERLAWKSALTGRSSRAAYAARSIEELSDADSPFDGSSYRLIVSPEKLNDALALQADMIQRPLLAADEISKQASALAQENKWRYDDPPTYARLRLYDIALPDHRVGPASDEAMRSVTREQVSQLYQSLYRPERLVIAVVGDVLTFNTLVEIQRLYGGFKAAGADQEPGAASKARPEIKRQETKPEPAQSSQPSTPASRAGERAASQPSTSPEAAAPGERDQEKTQAEPNRPTVRYGADRSDINQSIVSVGFQAAGLNSKDWPSLEVLAALIGQGRGSRLHGSLFEGQGLVSRVESDYLALLDTGLLTVQMWMAPNEIDKAESAFFKEIDRLRREIPTEGEMARAKSLLEKRFIDQTGNYSGRALALARAEAAPGGFRAALNYRNIIRAVRAEDVQRAAAEHLTLAGACLHEYEPFSAAPRAFDSSTFTATVLAWAPTFAQPVNAKDVRAAESHPSMALVAQGSERSIDGQYTLESLQPLPVRDFSTLNGPRAFVREDHSQPKVTVALLFQGGRIAEDETNNGVTELMLRSLLYGTAQRTPAQVAHEMEQLGAEIQIVSEPDFYGLVLGVLSRNGDRALKMLRNLIEEPALREEYIALARAAQIAAIQEDKDSAIARSRELLYQAIFPGHPYSFPAHGREEVVAKLKSEQVKEWHARTIKRQIPLAIIVGDTDGSALVSGEIAEGFKRRDVDASMEVKVPQPRPAEKVEHHHRLRTVATIGLPGPKADSADLPVVELIEAAMNGRGGRLLSELQEKQNIAHAAKLGNEALFAAGVIYAQVITSPENEQRARAALLGEIDRLARTGLSDEEIAGARALAATSRLAILQSQEARSLAYARAVFYQRDASQVDAFAEFLSKVTADDIKRVLAAYFKTSAASTGVFRGIAPPTPPKQNQN